MQGYNSANAYHAGVQVAYSDTAGNANALGGLGSGSYRKSDYYTRNCVGQSGWCTPAACNSGDASINIYYDFSAVYHSERLCCSAAD